MESETGEQIPDHVAINKALWDEQSAEYQRKHQATLSGESVEAWGVWRIPEAELQVLGEVAGLDVLELGCGGAQWSIALAKRGARPVGLDISREQLAFARTLMAASGVDFPLIQANAEAVPLAGASFDIVFCDWGAMTFCDPYRTVPEASRLLRPGGLLAFSTANPIWMLCNDMSADQTLPKLVNDYFGMHRFEWDDEVNFQLGFGEWIHLFGENKLQVESLIEPRAPAAAESTYRDAGEHAWSRRWPAEAIWRVRKIQ